MDGEQQVSTHSSGGLFGLGLDRAAWAHIVPFLSWLVLMSVLGRVGLTDAWAYAIRAALCLGLFIWFRPWRYYSGLSVRHLPLSFGVGVLVCLLWIVPEVGLGGKMSDLRELYLRFGILPLGRLPSSLSPSPYDPSVCGWLLTLIRLSGSAFVIAILEEFFWRGFLYRRLLGSDFVHTDAGEFDWEAFLIMVALFGVEHRRWLAGALAGAAYGLLYIRTRDIWSVCIAHVLTNFLLGVYVIRSGAYIFW
jgi:membrane protease YdiL (CAAX protease family)